MSGAMYFRFRRIVEFAFLLLAVLFLLGSPGRSTAQNVASAVKNPAETFQGIPVGFTADGQPFRGNPKAPLTLVEYSDFLCPFCERYFSQTLPTLLEKYARTGQVKLVLRDFPLASLHPTAQRGAVAAGCVAEQGAALFWAMYEALFQAQREWNRLPDPTAFLAKLASQVGADMAPYEACMASGRQEARVQGSVAAAQALGFNGTPTFQFLNGPAGKTYTLVGAQPVDVFTRWLDALLAGKEPPKDEQTDPAQARKPELPFWAKPEGLAPDRNRPGFTVAGDRYKGSPDAKVVLIEFEDFQCPACQRHALTTQPELDRRFVDTGEVRWIVKQFTLGIHPRAPAAAAAAQCAGDQGKFWPMHRLLFERLEQWSTSDDPDATLTVIAADLGLEKTRFTVCLASRQALEPALRDLYDGQSLGIRSVPSFVVFQGGAPFVLVGTRSIGQFATLLQRQVESAKAASSPATVGVSTMGR
jgi:protein-disulfide isomerase